MSAQQAFEPFTTRSLCFALPLTPGERVLVVGAHPAVTRSLRLRGLESETLFLDTGKLGNPRAEATAVVGSREAWMPFPAEAFDHVIVPWADPRWLPPLATELTRVLRQGGTAFVGVSTPQSWRLAPADWAVRSFRRMVAADGLQTVRVYGIRPDLSTARFLVPVDSREARRWFTAAVSGPRRLYWFAEAVAARLPLGPAAGAFPGLGIVLCAVPRRS